jgi:hypothetical protein
MERQLRRRRLVAATSIFFIVMMASVTGLWLSTPLSADPAAGYWLLSGVGAGPPPDGVR